MINSSTSNPWSWSVAGRTGIQAFSMMTYKCRKLGQNDLVFWTTFIITHVHTRWQVSTCGSYDSCHSVSTQTDGFQPVILLAELASWAKKMKELLHIRAVKWSSGQKWITCLMVMFTPAGVFICSNSINIGANVADKLSTCKYIKLKHTQSSWKVQGRPKN